ncbi:MAG: NAD(P)-dependent oxidoreductase [Nocardioides sp.]
MTDPLVWLPFAPALLGGVPEGLRVAEVVPDGPDLPDGADEVELVVPAYDWDVDLAVLSALPRLRVVQTLTAGYEHVLPHLPAGVTLCNGRGIHESSTSELALALILASLRGIPGFVRAQERGEWVYAPRPALADRRVLIVGYGAIGAAVEARLTPFETEVVRVASRPREGVHGVVDLPRLLPEADVVVLVVPLTDATRGLVDPAFLAAMKRGRKVPSGIRLHPGDGARRPAHPHPSKPGTPRFVLPLDEGSCAVAAPHSDALVLHDQDLDAGIKPRTPYARLKVSRGPTSHWPRRDERLATGIQGCPKDNGPRARSTRSRRLRARSRRMPSRWKAWFCRS